MTKKRDMSQEELDRRHEAQFEKAFGEGLDLAGIHFNVAPEDNVPLQVFNQVLREQARKKVN